MEPLNKNTEVVGVSDALKQLATKKLSPNNASFNPPSLQKQSPIDDGTILDNKITINPSSSSVEESTTAASECENGRVSSQGETPSCGWWKFRPACIQHFMNPRYALAFLCLAGAIQGNCSMIHQNHRLNWMLTDPI